MNRETLKLLRDEDGGPLVEVTVMIPILFTLLLGSVDFLNVYIQWNQATKAAEVGARIAAVSDPVATGMTGTTNIATNWLTASCTQDTFTATCMPYFQVTCDGSGGGSCTCTSGTCTGMGTYSGAAMNLIFYGRDGNNACGDAANYYFAGICDIYNPDNTGQAFAPANVKVIYTQTGLGYPGRPAGPVPTITVELQNVPFQFFFLKGFLRFANINVNNNVVTTITGEALSSAAAN